ncbi:MAG: Holliday junction branch migration protein RuvA [Schwartzia sp.]|nr:Holliday junction branch migration protein RuvA [Schwartzia sp. (in: firmicutes)]
MIGFLRGKVAHLLPEYCLIDVGGVGYIVYVSQSTRGRLSLNEDAMLFTHLAVREDALTLYGFSSQEEYNVFQLLISVSGIGPKVALGVLSAINVDALCAAIHGQQLSILTKLPGIGKKTAQRMVLELKDKVSSEGAGQGNEAEPSVTIGDDLLSEATAALMALGYSSSEITPVIRRAGDLKTVQEIIRFVLREIGGK